MAALPVTIIGGTAVAGGQLGFFDAVHPVAVNDAAQFQVQAYSRAIAELLSKVAGWSYSDLETFKKQLASFELPGGGTVLAGGEFTEIQVNNEAMFVAATAQIIVTADGLTAIVSFRGTELTNISDWLTDASTRKVILFVNGLPARPQIRVHQGFKRNFQAVWYGFQGVLEVLTSRSTLQAIYITGHSLGAAMSLLAGLALQHENNEPNNEDIWGKVRGIYTYGQPMVVADRDKNECQTRIGARLFRHIYFNDLVPHLPPLSVGAFDHAGVEYKYHPRNG
jgi:hypothetical protein